VRTLAQDLWSEMSHDSVYKSEEALGALPADVQRRVNLMAGQIEVADREFDRLHTELPRDANLRILKILERHYYRLASKEPNLELSIQILCDSVPLYGAMLQKPQVVWRNF